MIRSTKHSLKFANADKKAELTAFLTEYQRVGQEIIDFIWQNGYGEFNVAADKLEFPLYLDYKVFPVKTQLSARALSSLVTQISGAIRSAVKKRSKLSFVIRKKRAAKEDVSKLETRLATKCKLVKPTFPAHAELSSKCADIVREGSFGWFLRVKSTGFKPIKLPIPAHKRSEYWLARGTLKNSFLIRSNTVELRYEVKAVKSKGTKTVGIDQGVKSIATLSDGSVTPDTCPHGHSFDSVCDKLARKKKGSKAFEKAQAHRKNLINWSLNQIAWDTFAEVRLEKIWNIGFGKRRSRKLSHFTNTLIRDKIKRCCEELEVPVVEQDSSYRSQRCSNCGIVRKANRKGKEYRCKHCGFESDSDLNAAKNHLANLPIIDWTLRGQKYNLGNGFYWRESGLTTFDGQELRVPDSPRKI